MNCDDYLRKCILLKTTQLLKLLTAKERKDFLLVIKNNKRRSTQKLLDVLLKYKKKNRPELFEAVFDKKYEENKDYLLRNELRILNQHLEKFIACKGLNAKEEKILFLKAIQKKGLNDLFEKEIKKEIEKNKEDDDFRGLAKLYELLVNKHLSNKSFTNANLQKMMTLNEQLLFFQKKAAFYEQSTSFVTKAFLTKNINLSSETLVFEELEIIPEKYDDIYLQYLKNKALGYVQPIDKRRENLQKALTLIDDVNYYNFDKKAAKVAMLSNLALEYFLAFDYQKALLAYEELIAIGTITGQSRDYVLFNYLNCLLKAEEYKKAIHLIESDFSGIVTSPVLSGRIQCVKAMARIFNGELALAYTELAPDSRKNLRNNYFYSRLVLTIIFYLEDNIDFAKREVNNILQTIEAEEEFLHLIFCAKAFRKFLALKKGFKSESPKRERLLSSVNSFINVKNTGSDILPLLWLKRELSK